MGLVFASAAMLLVSAFGAELTYLTPAQSKSAQDLIESAMESSFGYERLAELCDRFGPRFSGSQALEDSIDWILEAMRTDGLENVRGERVEVPHWVRGKESLAMVYPREEALPMLGLGGSIATPEAGIEASVLVVSSFDELREKAAQAKGRIVLFNAPFTEYRETVVFRVRGAIEAAKVGAVASLIRSVGPVSLQTPHTGGMAYEDGVAKIPHAAITLEDAERLHRFQERGLRPRIRLMMEAESFGNTSSRNVVAEIVGRERPEEIVVVSGHIDSWDVGQGAQDDGGGCLVAWEAVRLMKRLGLRPRRTVRVVLWTNEENGTRGAKAYVKQHADQLDKHVLAIESDTGIGRPYGFAFTGSDSAGVRVREIGNQLEKLGSDKITLGAGGADVRHLLMAGGVPIMDLNVDRTKYFWYHHTHADTVDKIDPSAFRKCVATMAVMAYLVADLEESLPR